MSALTGCIKGCEATGLINPNKRSDCYTEVTTVINQMLEADGHATMRIPRTDAKQAVMTSGYGSEAKPIEIFGDFVGYFRQATMDVAPGAFKLMPVLVKTWNKNALDHSWVMPDGFNVFIPVIKKDTVRLRIDELQGASVYFEYKENAPLDYAKANCANVIHSVDALVLRNMIRRCSYDVNRVEQASDLLTMRILSQSKTSNEFKDAKLEKLVELAQKNVWIDPIFIDFITEENVYLLPVDIAQELNNLISKMLEHEPFDLITIHDAFKCHPRYGNTVRYWYKEIMAELSESNILANIYSQLMGKDHKFNKYGDIAHLIRQSNYGLS